MLYFVVQIVPSLAIGPQQANLVVCCVAPSNHFLLVPLGSLGPSLLLLPCLQSYLFFQRQCSRQKIEGCPFLAFNLGLLILTIQKLSFKRAVVDNLTLSLFSCHKLGSMQFIGVSISVSQWLEICHLVIICGRIMVNLGCCSLKWKVLHIITDK